MDAETDHKLAAVALTEAAIRSDEAGVEAILVGCEQVPLTIALVHLAKDLAQLAEVLAGSDEDTGLNVLAACRAEVLAVSGAS